MIWIKKQTLNANVTNFYLETIGNSFKRIGQPVNYFSTWSEYSPQNVDCTIIATAKEALRLIMQRRKYVFWAQGVWPEESFMRNHSRIRLKILGFIEKIALQHASFVFFVSDTMRQHYETKYNLTFTRRHYIMPCSNEIFHQEQFFEPQKYTDNVFCYVGSISVWQCFDETLELYRKIELSNPNVRLLLLVKDRDTALSAINKYGIEHYEIDYVPVEQLPEKLKKVKFGFIIRDNNIVNKVATPTKLLTYLANGIIPIYSDSLDGLKEILNGAKYSIMYHNDGVIETIKQMMATDIQPEGIMEEYKKIYNKWYERLNHEERIAELLQSL